MSALRTTSASAPAQGKIRAWERASIVILELLVGAIITFGGFALATFASDKALGIVHASLGLLAFPVAVGLWMGKRWAWTSGLVLNIVSIGYSTASEIVVVSRGLLTSPQLEASIYGTAAAILVSLATVYMLFRVRRRY